MSIHNNVLSPSKLADFNQNGFVCLQSLFTMMEVKEISNAIDELEREDPISCIGKQMVYLEDNLLTGQGKVYAKIEKFIEYSTVLNELVYSPKLIGYISQLFGERPVLFKDKINFKLSGGHGFEPHQDIYPGWVTYASYFISALITIDASTPSNGCLEVVVGYHERDLPERRRERLTQEQWKSIEFISYPTSPGDVLLFDCFVPHRSAPNLSDDPRRNLYLTYNPESQGDHRLRYFTDKRCLFPPNYEREPGKTISFSPEKWLSST